MLPASNQQMPCIQSCISSSDLLSDFHNVIPGRMNAKARFRIGFGIRSVHGDEGRLVRQVCKVLTGFAVVFNFDWDHLFGLRF